MTSAAAQAAPDPLERDDPARLARLEAWAARALDFDDVLANLERHAPTSLGLRALRALAPLDESGTRFALARAAEALILEKSGTSPSLAGVTDPLPPLQAARRAGRALEDTALVALRAFLDASGRLGTWLRDGAGHPADRIECGDRLLEPWHRTPLTPDLAVVTSTDHKMLRSGGRAAVVRTSATENSTRDPVVPAQRLLELAHPTERSLISVRGGSSVSPPERADRNGEDVVGKGDHVGAGMEDHPSHEAVRVLVPQPVQVLRVG